MPVSKSYPGYSAEHSSLMSMLPAQHGQQRRKSHLKEFLTIPRTHCGRNPNSVVFPWLLVCLG